MSENNQNTHNVRIEWYGIIRKGSMIVFFFLVALLVCSIISFGCSFIPAHPIIASIALKLGTVFQPQALSGIIGAIGVTGIVFGWLITRVEDHICGVRYAELVEWLFPYFFSGYFLIFIPSALIGNYAGRLELWWPTVFAGLEVFLHTALLIVACIVFVVRSDKRERVAFFYYSSKLNNSKDDITEAEIHSYLLKAADYTHMLIRREHRDEHCGDMLDLWGKGLERCSALGNIEKKHTDSDNHLNWHEIIPNYWCDESSDSVLNSIVFSRKLWDALLEGENSSPARADIILPILLALTKEERRHILYPIQIGLVQELFDRYYEPKDAVEELAKLLQHFQKYPISKELVACAVTKLMVLSLIESDKAKQGFIQAQLLLWPQINELMKDIDSTIDESERESEISCLILYAEWYTRREFHISLAQYMIWVDKNFCDQSKRGNALLNMNQEGWHLKMLACILCELNGQNLSA